MYSYEDRIRAVKLYIRLGKRLSMTVRQLGYPTTKALERWYRVYEQSHDLPAGRICLKPIYLDAAPSFYRRTAANASSCG